MDRLTPVDPDDDALVDAWHAVYLRSQRHDSPPEAVTAWTLPEMRARLQQGGRRVLTQAWVGAEEGAGGEGRVVATGLLVVPLLDNLRSAQVYVDVDPDARHRGHGRALAQAMLAAAAERGRTVVSTETGWPVDAPMDGAGEAGPGLARSLGFSLGITEVLRVLDAPVPDQRLDALAAEAAPHHTAYTLRDFVGPVPDDLVEQWAALTATLTTEAPMGTMTLEAEAAEVALVREDEELMVRQGRVRYATVALSADGVLAGYTELVTTVHEPGLAYQWGTLVARAHRGHRLGVALKVANQRLIQRHDATHGGIRAVRTWNADSNAPMVAVNEALGFRPVRRFGGFERTT